MCEEAYSVWEHALVGLRAVSCERGTHVPFFLLSEVPVHCMEKREQGVMYCMQGLRFLVEGLFAVFLLSSPPPVVRGGSTNRSSPFGGTTLLTPCVGKSQFRLRTAHRTLFQARGNSLAVLYCSPHPLSGSWQLSSCTVLLTAPSFRLVATL